MLWAIAFATPFFLFFGWLSDKIGRKWIMMAGMLLGIVTYRPIFDTFLKDSDAGKWAWTGIKTKKALPIQNKIDDNHSVASFAFTAGNGSSFHQTITTDLKNEKQTFTYTNKHLPPGLYWKFIGLVFLLILYVTMVYGPIAAFLVELFPTKIRYTSMSLPYHIGNGVFGGLVPFIGLLLTTTYPKDPLVGLWYPISVAALCLTIGIIYLNNKIDKNVDD